MGDRDSERIRLAELRTNHRTALWSGSIALVGLMLLWCVTGLDWFEGHTTLKALLEELGGILLTTGGLAVLWDLRGKRDIVSEVLAKVELGSDVATTGLRRSSMDWRVVPWTRLIGGSRQIDIYISYGTSWLSMHSSELTEFAKARRNKMRYLLPDPEDAASMSALAERYDSTPEAIRTKVLEAARTVAKLSRNGSADIRVRYRKGAPCFTCYRFDDTVVVTLYQHKVGKNPVPTLIIDQGTFSTFFRADLDAIVEQSREVAIAELLGDANAN